MIDRIISFVEEHKLLSQGDCVTVGLSGGADSVALLYILMELAPRYCLSLLACHVNHQLRGEEGDGDQEFCRSLCERLEIPFVTRKIEVRAYCKAKGLSIEMGARELRYQVLYSESPGKIATAHHADDNAETVLMNLLRGTALDGLCGIAPIRGRIIRPLLCVCRGELEEYLAKLDQDYRTDRTNLEDGALRNRLRRHVLPLLQKENPAFSQGVSQMTEALRCDRELLDQMSRALLDKASLPISRCSTARLVGLPLSPELAAWSREILAAQPQGLRLRAFKLICTDWGLAYDRPRLQRLDRLLDVPSAIQLDPATRFVADEARVWIERETALAPIEPVELAAEQLTPRVFRLSEHRSLTFRNFSEAEIKLSVNKCNFEFENLFDCDKIDKIIRLRSRREGDTVRHQHRQSLKKLMNAAAVAPALRPGLALLEDAQGIFWIEGFGVSERAAVSRETRRAVLIEIRKEETK